MSDTPNNWQFRMAEHAAITLLCPECSKKETENLMICAQAGEAVDAPIGRRT
jgi:hypothetical protein